MNNKVTYTYVFKDPMKFMEHFEMMYNAYRKVVKHEGTGGGVTFFETDVHKHVFIKHNSNNVTGSIVGRRTNYIYLDTLLLDEPNWIDLRGELLSIIDYGSGDINEERVYWI
jgi:hypothetical protein